MKSSSAQSTLNFCHSSARRQLATPNDESYNRKVNLPRDYQEINTISVWLSSNTGQGFMDRIHPGETPEAALRRLILAPPVSGETSKIIPCDGGGMLLIASNDLHAELVMRSGPGESMNTLIRRLIILSDIYFTKNFRVPTTEEKRWINQDRRGGTDRNPRRGRG